jgi:hypothetical protein
MEQLLQLLEHLITYGPARNPAELERLLQLLVGLRPPAAPAPEPPAPDFPPAPAQPQPGGVPL